MLNLLKETEEVSFKTSNKTIAISKNNSRESGFEEISTASATIHNNTSLGDNNFSTFLRKLHFYLKEISANFITDFELLFRPSSSSSAKNATEFIFNRTCLNYALNRHIHFQRNTDRHYEVVLTSGF